MPSTGTPRETPYALRLEAAADASGTLRGCIEHVLSGRIHRFDDGADLLAWLRQDLARAEAIKAPSAPSAAPSCRWAR
jgi:hypothetical protein